MTRFATVPQFTNKTKHNEHWSLTYYFVPKELPTKSYPKIDAKSSKTASSTKGRAARPFCRPFIACFCSGLFWVTFEKIENLCFNQCFASETTDPRERARV